MLSWAMCGARQGCDLDKCARVSAGTRAGQEPSVATDSQGGDKLIDSWRNNGTSSLFHRHCLTPGWLAAAAAWCAA